MFSLNTTIFVCMRSGEGLKNVDIAKYKKKITYQQGGAPGKPAGTVGPSPKQTPVLCIFENIKSNKNFRKFKKFPSGILRK